MPASLDRQANTAAAEKESESRLRDRQGVTQVRLSHVLLLGRSEDPDEALLELH